jgi:hypothetical protein
MKRCRKKGTNIGMKDTKKKRFKKGDLVLLYDNKCFQCLGKFRMHWLGPYEIKYVTYGGSMHIKDLTRTKMQGMVNGIQLKLYRYRRPTNSQQFQCSKEVMCIVYYSIN